MKKAQKRILDIISPYFAPRRKETPSQWAEREYRLDPSTGTSGGFDLKNRPFFRDIIDTVADRNTTFVGLAGSVKICKTTNTLVVPWAWKAVHDPVQSVWFFPSESARDELRGDLNAALELCEPLKVKVRKALKGMIQFQDHKCLLKGAGTEKQVRGVHGGQVNCTETSAIKIDPKAGDYTDLMINRGTAYDGNRQARMESTVIDEHDPLWRKVTEGTFEHCHVPCPKCGYMQALEFKTLIPGKEHDWQNPDSYHYWLQWDKDAKKDGKWIKQRVKDSARMQCQRGKFVDGKFVHECGYMMKNDEKYSMFQKYKWVSYNENPTPGWRTFRLPVWYSAFESNSWGEMALKFLDCVRRKQLHMWDQNYTVTPTRVDTFTRMDPIVARKLLGRDYALGSLPPWEKTAPDLILRVDVQNNYFVFSIRAYYENGNDYLIHSGVVNSWAELDSLELDEYYADDSTVTHKVAWTIIDSHHEPLEVHKWIAAKPLRRVAIWHMQTSGASVGKKAPYVPTYIDPFSGTKDQGGMRIFQFQLCNDTWRKEMFKYRLGYKTTNTAGKEHGMFIPRNVPEYYLEQLFDEWIDIDGKEKNSKNNHQGDLEKYSLAFSTWLTETRQWSWHKKARQTANANAPAKFSKPLGGTKLL